MASKTSTTSETVDFIVVGSGAAGGIMARELAQVAIWIGYLVAYAVSAAVGRLMIGARILGRGAAGPEQWEALIQYPISAVLSGLAFFMMGSGYWGLYYVLGVAFFALALLMPLSLTWAPLELGGVWAASLVAIGFHLRHFASSFNPSRISRAVSAASPALRVAAAMAAAACG